MDIVLHILEFLHGRGRKKLILDVGISHVEDTLQVVVCLLNCTTLVDQSAEFQIMVEDIP
jgi:hypothetical protein